MASFSTRLASWCAQMRELGQDWTPKKLDEQTGINRGHWHHWLSADAKLAEGLHLPPTRQHPTTAQWATIFAKMPLDFVISFDDYRPGLAEVVNANRTCLWCGRAFHSKWRSDYCSDRHWGEMQMWRRAEKRHQREERRKQAG